MWVILYFYRDVFQNTPVLRVKYIGDQYIRYTLDLEGNFSCLNKRYRPPLFITPLQCRTNPLYSNISMLILNTVWSTFLMALMRKLFFDIQEHFKVIIISKAVVMLYEDIRY